MTRLLLTAALLLPLVPAAVADDDVRPAWALVIHGGAGTILPEKMTPAKAEEYRAALRELAS